MSILPYKKLISSIRHPNYSEEASHWKLWRDTWEGGQRFIETYLDQYTIKEDYDDFQSRKSMTPLPAFAKSGVNEVKNAIFQRLVDVVRNGGTASYQAAIDGDLLGVDLKGSSMNNFIGSEVLPDMLVMRKIGVYVDMPIVNEKETVLEARGKRPYLYSFPVEQICSWKMLSPNTYSDLLLLETVETYEDQWGLPSGNRQRYRHIWLDNGVWLQFYTDNGEEESAPIKLNIPEIPFYVFNIEDSLMEDVANYQIALMRLTSSDVNFCYKANFPLYTEQQDNVNVAYAQQRLEEAGETESSKIIPAGTQTGRTYAPKMERPGWINPSPEPLMASMEKQAQLKTEIRQLIDLKLIDMGKRASADSKQEDSEGLEAGLAYIGARLAIGERKLAQFWSMYENSQNIATIKYPIRYELKRDKDRIDEAKGLKELKTSVNSKTFQKEVSKRISYTLLGCRTDANTLKKINTEIDSAEALDFDGEKITRDVEIGLLAKKHAAEIKGYPKDTVEIAQEEHAERLADIAKSQSEGAASGLNSGARGVPDNSSDPKNDVIKEKAKVKDTTFDSEPMDKTRGQAK